jgi:ATP-binding cassette subfamily B protein
VLRGISFVAKAGQTTAIIGSTGSGKSTVVNLIPRFRDVTMGEVLVDGINVRDFAKDDLMRRIGYVPQKGFLFSGTVRSNILFGIDKTEVGDNEDALDKRMKKGAEIAQAAECVEKMPDGYESKII